MPAFKSLPNYCNIIATTCRHFFDCRWLGYKPPVLLERRYKKV
ncbi:hypothetical protein GMMP15_1510041 [Candidatus Magnetomoraceae bacterium gMMP-15]